MVDKGKGFQIFAHILLSFLIICAICTFHTADYVLHH